MAMIRIEILDHTGRRTQVELPDDVPMSKLVPALVSKMGFPLQQAGSPIIYRVDHERSGRRLQGTDTFEAVGVEEDDKLRLLPELTPGDREWIR